MIKNGFLIDKKQSFIRKIKRLVEKEGIPKISSLISLEIVRKGRPFTEGVFIKQLLKKI